MKEEIEKKMLEAIDNSKADNFIPDFYQKDLAEACASVASSIIEEKEKEIAELKEKLEKEYQKGYEDATSEAFREISKNYTPNPL